jgi:hypothetical protein
MNYMKKIIFTALVTAVVATGVTPIMPATVALAQSGSRLCGYTTKIPTSNIGFLYEAREASSSYTKQCEEALDKIWNQIKKDPNLKNLEWKRRYKEVCQDVGPMFTSQNSDLDMCNYMSAEEAYQVVWDAAKNKTTYTKL